MEYNSQYLQICGVLGIDVTYAHDNREFFDYIVENNQKRLIFANITEKWYLAQGIKTEIPADTYRIHTWNQEE